MSGVAPTEEKKRWAMSGVPPTEEKKRWIASKLAPVLDKMLARCVDEMPEDPAPFMQSWLERQVLRPSFNFNNILMLTDSYKVTHHLQYPPGTSKIYSYFESRGGQFEEVCFFGLQYFIKQYLVGPVVTLAKINEAEMYFKLHFKPGNPAWPYQENLFNRAGWEHIVKNIGGMLPISIKAVPEGTVVPVKNILFSMENTDDMSFWLTNYLESLLVQVWYPTTVCTSSREQKKIIVRYMQETGCDEQLREGAALFKMVDFGFRGVSSVESAAIGGAGHLVSFKATDTMAAYTCCRDFYGEPMAGFAIPASEHSTMTSWGKEREKEAMQNFLTQYPKGLIACVSDSYDIFKACEEYWGTALKAQIEQRPGRLLVRPDSGELPVTVLQVLETLASKFGTSMTSTQHKLLPPCVRVIQGDGIDIGSLDVILKAMKDAGWAADNIAFGSGGALLQKLHRDTQKVAFKCSHAIINGKGVDVFKDPATDPGKRSKKGRLTLEKKGGRWRTVEESRGNQTEDRLVEVYCNGILLVDHKLADIIARADGEEKATIPVQISTRPVEDSFDNIIMLTDSYKVTHHLQYPPGTARVYSYFECRGGLYEDVCFFGLQYLLKRYLAGKVVTRAKLDQAEANFRLHFADPAHGYDERLFNRSGWEHIIQTYDGHLPVEIKAVAEGTVVTYRNILFSMENTDDKCYWLTNYLETLLVQAWYPCTVCTQSREQKKIIMKFLKETGCEHVIRDGLHLFKLHDFGFRGVSSVESAAIGGAAHLVNFSGTDTMAALMLAKEYYLEDCAGGSIPASEHSTITSWTRQHEVDAMRNMLTKYPTGIIACVSDSFDVFNACEKYWGTDLKAEIEQRNGQLVVRPDSGELPQTVLQVLAKLGSKFKTTLTCTGHKLLPPTLRVLQGDGINIDSLQTILQAMKDDGWAADNLAFGSGGALLQKLHRDTQKVAFKCSYTLAHGQGMEVFKDPITDPGKKSKKGKLSLERNANGGWTTVEHGKGTPDKDELKTVFLNGQVLITYTFKDIRNRAVQGL